jgi:hypothetical protein
MSYDEGDDSARALARLAFANHHGSLLSDASQANYERTLMLARNIEAEGCPSCELLVDVVPAAFSRWGVKHSHEPGCA